MFGRNDGGHVLYGIPYSHVLVGKRGPVVVDVDDDQLHHRRGRVVNDAILFGQMIGLNVWHHIRRRAVDLQLQVYRRFFHVFERVQLPVDGSYHVYSTRFCVDGKEVRFRCIRRG